MLTFATFSIPSQKQQNRIIELHAPFRLDMEWGEAAMGCWFAGVRPWHVECDRFYNKFIVRCYGCSPSRFLLPSEYLSSDVIFVRCDDDLKHCQWLVERWHDNLLIDFFLFLVPHSLLGAKRNGNQSVCRRLAARKVGYMGSNADLRGIILRREHLQLPQARVHLLGESSSGTASSLVIAHGDWHHEVLLLIRARFVCLQ